MHVSKMRWKHIPKSGSRPKPVERRRRGLDEFAVRINMTPWIECVGIWTPNLIAFPKPSRQQNQDDPDMKCNAHQDCASCSNRTRRHSRLSRPSPPAGCIQGWQARHRHTRRAERSSANRATCARSRRRQPDERDSSVRVRFINECKQRERGETDP